MGKKTLPYIGLCTGMYLLLGAFEIFLCKPLIDFIGFGYRTHLIVFLLLLLLVDPLIVRYVADKTKYGQNKEIRQEGELL
ncbi:MAG: hypothetical protein IKS51_02930 [Erysipelotrichaceae bacterium]|nr:hypothetical protein [Erysipelotrichaceae bacterium]